MRVQLIALVSLTNSLDLSIANAAENRDFAGSVDIGSGRKVYLKCTGEVNSRLDPVRLRLMAAIGLARVRAAFVVQFLLPAACHCYRE